MGGNNRTNAMRDALETVERQCGDRLTEASGNTALLPHIRALLGEVSPEANLASTLIRPATVDDLMHLADVMAQRLAEYLYDYEDGKSKEARDALKAARDALKAALVSGVVEVTDGMKGADRG